MISERCGQSGHYNIISLNLHVADHSGNQKSTLYTECIERWPLSEIFWRTLSPRDAVLNTSRTEDSTLVTKMQWIVPPNKDNPSIKD